MFKIPNDGILMNDKEEDPYFKVKIRKKFTKPNQDVVCTIGDQFTDVFLPGGNTMTVKLPEPKCKCSYIFMPKQ